jgi:hypothetical protein
MLDDPLENVGELAEHEVGEDRAEESVVKGPNLKAWHIFASST